MDDDEVLDKLEDLAESLGIVVRYEPTEDGRSGVCKLRGVKTAIVHSELSTRGRIAALVGTLCPRGHRERLPATRHSRDAGCGAHRPLTRSAIR